MKKFMLIYRAPKSFSEHMAQVSMEDAQKHMQPWMDWAEKCGNQMVDMGTPLGNGHAMSRDEHGPSASDVVGFSVLQAESMEAVRPLVENHPHILPGDGCSVEVLECVPLPGM